MGKLTLNQFVAKYNGKRVDVDGYPKAQPYQCYDLAWKYDSDVVGGKGLYSGNGCAAGIFYNFSKGAQAKYYTRVTNNPNDSKQVPPSGAIVIWDYSLTGSGGCGHVDICLSSNRSGFTGFDQNWGGAYAHKVYHNYGKVVGWLVPKTSAKPKPSALYYKVRPGDYLIKIAGRFKTTLARLRLLNPKIKNPNKISIGQKIRVK